MSEVKVNKISPRTACGTTTLGDSGDTFTLPSGATMTVASGATITNSGTASGFGATGETSWETTVKTTGTFTPTAGVGYFLNTTGGIITVNLPVGAAGSSVAMADYAATWQTNNVTVSPNGSEPIGGVNADVTLETEGQAVTFVYIDATQGWVNVLDSTSNVRGAAFVVASGGDTTITCGNFKTHIFTGPGTFCVSCGGGPGSSTVDYIVVAGGGAGGFDGGGGGGAGGFRLSNSVGCIPAPSTSPLANPTGLPVSVQGYPVTVGAGAACKPTTGLAASGSDSVFSCISSAGGGGGSPGGPACRPAGNGGSGAGGDRGTSSAPDAGTGNTPPTSPAQGTPGTVNGSAIGGGGGGGGAAAISDCNGNGGTGSYGAPAFFGPTAPSYGQSPAPLAPNGRYFSGGGAGGHNPSVIPGATQTGGAGGGGGGGVSGTVNTGGGGGGGDASGPIPQTGKGGGSGIVMIRYKFQ